MYVPYDGYTMKESYPDDIARGQWWYDGYEGEVFQITAITDRLLTVKFDSNTTITDRAESDRIGRRYFEKHIGRHYFPVQISPE